jgi:hypothetical protein
VKIEYTITQDEIVDALRVAHKLPFSADINFRWAKDQSPINYPIEVYGVIKTGAK